MDAETAFAIDFNLQQVPARMGLAVPPLAGAAMLRISEAAWLDYAAGVRTEMDAVADRLLACEAGSAGLAALRAMLPAGGTILAAGDSITTYRRGYVEMLRSCLARRYPEAGIEVVNAGYSGNTSTEALEYTYSQLLALRPALVTLMYGANDCKRFGGPAARPLVSPVEYAENIEAVVEAFRAHTAAQVILFTPAPVLTRVTNALPDFAPLRMTWDDADLAGCAAAVRRIAARHALLCVDLAAAFGPEPDPALYLPDGLHPGPRGHVLILDRFLDTLSQRRPG